MGEREQLLRTICERPTDDFARLVFADWCDENRRGWHAALIRLQTRGATAEEVRSLLDALYRDVQNVSAMRREFLIGDWCHWVTGEDLTKRPKLPVAIVRRGFTDELVMDLHQFHQCADQVFALRPVTQVRFTDMSSRLFNADDGTFVTPAARCPDWLYPLLSADDAGHAEPEGQPVWLSWTSRKRAKAVWSNAAVNFGRQLVGLPPFEPI